MAATDFIVAIELGSSKITGIAGKKHADGSIQVLALASENSSDFIRKGVIYNLDKTAQSLTSIIKKLESTLKASIGKVYVGIGGQSLRTIRNTEVRHLEEETKISQELIDSIMDSNREVPIIDQEILEVAPQEYKVGINLLADPVGVPSDHIEGRFLNIIARSSVKQNIDKCFKQAGIEIADYIISPLALANAVLTNSEKRSGCMFIDFGADTTTVSVYKNNILRHLAVIPLGGSNITKDICSQQIEEEDAEVLKKIYGNAYADKSEDGDDKPTYSLDGKCSIESHLLEDIVEARVNEILANVWNQIVLSGYEDKLLAGAIITGGAANLKNMEEAFSNRTKVEKVRMAKESQLSLKDKGSRGERVDTSGPRAAEILKEHGFKIVEEILLPDEEAQIKKHLIRLSDSRQVDLIITTGGTGLSPRDRTPEATLAVADRNVPGISEAIRAGSMTITKRAMLSRGVSVIRKKTLIINLPGSKKAVEESLSFIIDQLPHGLDTLRENTEDCGRN